MHGTIENFRYFGAAVATIGGRSNPIGGSLLFYSLKEPVGVAGQIVPWNYPLLMTTWKLAPALAAGCSIVLKPDPQTPLTALRLGELAAEVGFPPGSVNVVPGDGPTTGAYLVKHPGVDKVAFTGSTRTGGEIMRLCSDPIKRVTLELGGKCPSLVFADADLASAIPSSVWSIYYAAGQSCEARSRVLVEKPLYDEFVARFAELAGKIRVGDPLDGETQMGSLISQAHRERVHGFVDRAREEGGEVVLGRRAGRARLLSADGRGRDRQHGRDRPGGGLRPRRDRDPLRGRAGRDPDRERRQVRPDGHGLDRRSRAGDTGSRRGSSPGQSGSTCRTRPFPGIPFGGYKQSGFGRELGLDALDLYLETKSRDRLDEPEADQPVRPVERRATAGSSSPPGTFAQASFSAIGIGIAGDRAGDPRPIRPLADAARRSSSRQSGSGRS